MEKSIEKLVKYSKDSKQRCSEILVKNSNNFWLALFELTNPEKNKPKFVTQLLDASNDFETILALSNLEKIYSSSEFSTIKMHLYENDYQFFNEIGNPSGKESLHRISPDRMEIDCYARFLTSENNQVVTTTLQILQSISSTAFLNELTLQLDLLMRSERANLANEAIRTTFDDADKIELFKHALAFNLGKKRLLYHFNAIRAFWSLNAKMYPECIALFEVIAKSKNSQTRDMAKDILIRYSKLSTIEAVAQELTMKKKELLKIYKKVAAITTSRSLFTFVDRFNWDDDVEYMCAVVNHEQCEIAIAMMVYWRSCPIYYQRFSDVGEVEEYNQKTFLLQHDIEQKIEKGKFIKGKLSYDPANDNGHDFTKSNLEVKDTKRLIPNFMFP